MIAARTAGPALPGKHLEQGPCDQDDRGTNSRASTIRAEGPCDQDDRGTKKLPQLHAAGAFFVLSSLIIVFFDLFFDLFCAFGKVFFHK